jgi:hypothetical protein
MEYITQGRSGDQCPLSKVRAPIAAPSFHELWKVMGTGRLIDSGTAFLFEVPG